jgi:hypothetical protein
MWQTRCARSRRRHRFRGLGLSRWTIIWEIVETQIGRDIRESTSIIRITVRSWQCASNRRYVRLPLPGRREGRIEASALPRGDATDRCPKAHICNYNDRACTGQAANAERHFPYTRHRPGIAPHRRHPVRTKFGRCATSRACARFETRAASGQSGREKVWADTSLIVSANGVNVRGDRTRHNSTTLSVNAEKGGWPRAGLLNRSCCSAGPAD